MHVGTATQRCNNVSRSGSKITFCDTPRHTWYSSENKAISETHRVSACVRYKLSAEMFKRCLKHSITFSLVFLSSKRGKVIDEFQGRLVGFCFCFFLFRWWQMVPIPAVNNFEDCCIHQKLVISDRYTCLRNFLRFYNIWLLVIYNWEVLKVFISFFFFLSFVLWNIGESTNFSFDCMQSMASLFMDEPQACFSHYIAKVR